VLLRFKELFDGTLGDWNLPPVSFEIKEGIKPYHGRPYPIPHIHKAVIMKEINRLCKIRVLTGQPSSRWASPTFIIPKKDGTVRTISDFREGNKHIVLKPYPIPKISTTLQELKGFTYATALDLNMGYYTISRGCTGDFSKKKNSNTFFSHCKLVDMVCHMKSHQGTLKKIIFLHYMCVFWCFFSRFAGKNGFWLVFLVVSLLFGNLLGF